MALKGFSLAEVNKFAGSLKQQGIPHNTNIGCERKHTPIVSKKQRGLFGAELARRRAGKKGKMSGITTEELGSHLHESKGKKLSKRA